jgi:2-C-methyl-D-erythritol 4-phosphate cytidylyltransferase
MKKKRGSIPGVIVAAGRGKRLGGATPKAFVRLGAKAMVQYSLAAFDRHAAVGSIVLVVHRSMVRRAQRLVSSLALVTPVDIVTGGEHRWQSVRNGVNATPAKTEWVLVHDAARPFVTAAVIDALLEKRATYRCAITVTPVVDTIRRFEGDRCVATLERSRLVRVGTPQLFHRMSLVEAFAQAGEMDREPSDEAVLMESNGIAVGLAWGDPLNFKITTRQDLLLAEGLLAKKR